MPKKHSKSLVFNKEPGESKTPKKAKVSFKSVIIPSFSLRDSISVMGLTGVDKNRHLCDPRVPDCQPGVVFEGPDISGRQRVFLPNIDKFFDLEEDYKTGKVSLKKPRSKGLERFKEQLVEKIRDEDFEWQLLDEDHVYPSGLRDVLTKNAIRDIQREEDEMILKKLLREADENNKEVL